MADKKSKIIYTLTDEAPYLATCSLLPILRTFAAPAGIDIVESDISLAARILGEFSDVLTPEQKMPDNLSELGRLTLLPDTNIIKLPNISATVHQMTEAIRELQAHGYKLPNLPEDPKTDADKATLARYSRCLGSAVNPVLREGNSDRRAPLAVKNFARKHPHSMAEWSMASRTHVAHMKKGDFYHGEKSMTLDKACDVRMELVNAAGKATVLKPKVSLKAGEIIDSMFMSKKALYEFYEEQMEDARKTGLMLSLHVKATMMKISHPIVFGHAVRVYYKDAFAKHGKLFEQLGVNVNNGLSSLYEKLESLPTTQRDEVIRDLHACHEHRPELAMVDSAKGISNLHAPNDDFCKTNGNFDPVTMGTVPNVGLMAQQAEEYGSHDKTFEVAEAGEARIVDIATGQVLLTQNVEEGDIWRMCQVKDAPIRDWVKLAVTRARNSGMPAVFWLDTYRPHENEIIKKVELYLKDHDTSGLDIQIMSQVRAMRYTLERVVRGQDTISVTGNILRDYLTDLFPIMELGTSSKMLSVVPLMAGGGLYETGAGGSAPKHVQQLTEENHLRWDSLGEFLAIAASLEDLGIKTANDKAKLLAKTLDAATGKLLDNSKNPSPKTGQLDNRGSQFYLTLYWAQALAEQTQDKALQALFAPLAKSLTDNEQKIVGELNAVQGKPVDIGGYFKPDTAKMTAVMRPSATFNAALETVKA